jgi:5-methylthioadenosine/S-adenosylhomocysteine deaminase
LPGLVNVHAHLELTALRGAIEDRDFFRWIRRLTRTKYELLSADDLLASARWGTLEATRAGITTVGEVCDLGVSRQALLESGLRAVLFQEVFGPDPSAVESALMELRRKLDAHRSALGPRLVLGVSPHAPYTVSAPLFRGVTDLAMEGGYPICVHAAESSAEKDFVQTGTGPFADHLQARGIAWQPPGGSTVEYLESLGVLDARPLLVHCVTVGPGDVERMRVHGVRVAHCPKSNAKLGHGAAPLRALRAAGIPVGLGTDGVVSNNALDLFEEARACVLLDRALSRGCGPDALPAAADVLKMLTLGGAEALGLDREIGSLDVGKRADLTAVDLSGPHVEPVHDVETALVWSASARDVTFTMVGGEVLWIEGRLTRLDTEALRSGLEMATARLGAASKV